MTDRSQKMHADPILTFSSWLREETLHSKSKFPAACVLSSIGLNGFPNARNVSLKEVKHPFLIITCSLDSPKAKEIFQNPNVALTFWWESSGRQVRIQGIASEINSDDADLYFSERNKSSQAVSVISEQSLPMDNKEQLLAAYESFLKINKNNSVPRPDHWKGFKIEPVRIEFLEFEETRFHHRVLYVRKNEVWSSIELQP